ncbi:MAG TPA: ferrochelatase [Chthonomonadaceae bacterium]|nr:ferrochelatase [Chthonomonadaceae bacterium]
MSYDALLVVSFGGPESRDEVVPFLRNVVRGKPVPEERILEVAEHYYHFGGKSPINQQNRDLIAALADEFEANGPQIPIYWGNRNWNPYLADALAQMRADGVRRALAFVTSAFSSYSGCRQYLENIAAARAQVGPGAPEVDKLRAFYNHPGFVEATAEHVRAAFQRLPAGVRPNAQVVYTAHSIPISMALSSPYVAQLEESCRLVSDALGRSGDMLVYQSRSGAPGQPWLGPDILDTLREIKAQVEHPAVVIAPIGFVSDHMEVLYDLDTEARELCCEIDLPMERAATPGTHPAYVRMIGELVRERMEYNPVRRHLGSLGPSPDSCAEGCCPAAIRPRP